MGLYNEEAENTAKAGGYRVDDDSNLSQKDLKRSVFGGQDANPDREGYESHGMGGHAFGEMNKNRSGDDPANPSRNAGYNNEYFRRTEPSEEHPENQNFKPEHQKGAPDEAMGKDEEAIHARTVNQHHVGGAEGNPDKIQEGTESYHDGND